ARLIGAVVKDHRRTHPLAAVAIYGGEVRTADAVVLEPFVEGRHTGFTHPRLHQLADAIVDHRRGNAGLEAETIGKIGGHVVFTAGDVDLHGPRLAERNGPR